MVKVLPPPKPDIPEPAPGTVLSLSPAGHVNWLDDFEYYDQLGRDPLQQGKIWLIADPEERLAEFEKWLSWYPKQVHRRLMLSQAAKRGDEVLVRSLVGTGLKVHPDLTPLSEEDEQADQEARENGEIPDRDDPWVTPVHAAAEKGHLGCLKIFIEEGGVDVDVRDRDGRTPLILGTKYPEVVRYLLDLGADATAKTDPDSQTLYQYAGAGALEFAAAHANVESLELLLDHPHVPEEEGLSVTPLCIKSAAESGKGFDALKLLLERGGYPTEARDGKTKTELLSDEQRKAVEDAIPASAWSGQVESLKLLLGYVYPTDLDGNILPFELPGEYHRPFVYGAYDAMKANSREKFRFINSFGITEHSTMSLDGLPEGQNFNIQHLLDFAAEAGAVDTARFVIEKYGADPNAHRMPPGMKPLYVASVYDKPDMVHFLLESQGADIHLGSGRYATGPTALWTAINLNSLDCVELLLRHGGPVDHIDGEIREISAPMTVILKAEADYDTYETSVRLETEESAAEYLAGYKSMWKNLNPPFVRLEIGPEDKDWIDKLQERKPAEELREEGENARELNQEDGVSEEELEDGDPRTFAPEFPTDAARMSELRKDDDLIPEFKPWMGPA